MKQGITCSVTDIASLNEAISRARVHLLSLQRPEGCWAGELEADASVAAGYIPLMYFMNGRVEPERQRRVVSYVLGKQRADGSWSAYAGGPGDLNVTVQCYFALKLAGVSATEPFMRRGRDFVLAWGGIARANVFTKIWLAIFGQFDWRGTPSLPPEIMLLPDWFYFNLYEFGSWSRETIVALMIVLAARPVCKVPGGADISELYVNPEDHMSQPAKAERFFSWESFFLKMDSFFKAWEKLPAQPGRGRALRRAEKWLVEHQEPDGSWGGIMLPWIYALIGLKSLGYGRDHPVIVKGVKGLEGYLVDDNTTLRLQPATSPVWDTAWAIIALSESGLDPAEPALIAAGRWLLSKEVRTKGDWSVKTKAVPGGWSFEFENHFYPDIDDTALVPRALRRVRLPVMEENEKSAAIQRGLGWVLAMQSRDGGWAAFDRDNNKQFLTHIPFADFMTPLDPTSPDVTAHVIELLGELRSGQKALSRALDYLRASQEADGAWYGRWGVNYLYSTGLVLAGLRAAGADISQPSVRQAVSWLESCQNQDGGWGETCRTYDDPTCRGQGESTASQTAWALLGLTAASQQNSPVIEHGVQYLIETQKEDGSWQEDAFTGTGFPRAFYLRYDLYRIYFPLLALARYRALREGAK